MNVLSKGMLGLTILLIGVSAGLFVLSVVRSSPRVAAESAAILPPVTSTERQAIAEGVAPTESVPVPTTASATRPVSTVKPASTAGPAPTPAPVAKQEQSATQNPSASQTQTDEQAALVELSCQRLAFSSNSAQLTEDTKRVLDSCVMPILQQRTELHLKVEGSSAWPGPPGKYTEAQVHAFGKARAQAIVDYLVSQKIEPTRFLVEGILPPQDHRETSDPIKQAEDRFVQMTLIVSGLDDNLK